MICPISKVYYVCVWCTVGCYCIAVCSTEMRARGVVQVFGQRATLASTATQPSPILVPTRIWTICSGLFCATFDWRSLGCHAQLLQNGITTQYQCNRKHNSRKSFFKHLFWMLDTVKLLLQLKQLTQHIHHIVTAYRCP